MPTYQPNLLFLSFISLISSTTLPTPFTLLAQAGFLDVSQIHPTGILPQDICTGCSLCLIFFSPGHPQDPGLCFLQVSVQRLHYHCSLHWLFPWTKKFISLTSPGNSPPSDSLHFSPKYLSLPDQILIDYLNSVHLNEPLSSCEQSLACWFVFLHRCIPGAWNSVGIWRHFTNIC